MNGDKYCGGVKIFLKINYIFADKEFKRNII